MSDRPIQDALPVHPQLGPQHPGRSHPEPHRSGRFRGFSAGSSPRENQQPNPLGLQVLQGASSTAGLRSRTGTNLARADAPRMDLVITVCDNAAGEGMPVLAGWGPPPPIGAMQTRPPSRAATPIGWKRFARRMPSGAGWNCW